MAAEVLRILSNKTTADLMGLFIIVGSLWFVVALISFMRLIEQRVGLFNACLAALYSMIAVFGSVFLLVSTVFRLGSLIGLYAIIFLIYLAILIIVSLKKFSITKYKAAILVFCPFIWALAASLINHATASLAEKLLEQILYTGLIIFTGCWLSMPWLFFGKKTFCDNKHIVAFVFTLAGYLICLLSMLAPAWIFFIRFQTGNLTLIMVLLGVIFQVVFETLENRRLYKIL